VSEFDDNLPESPDDLPRVIEIVCTGKVSAPEPHNSEVVRRFGAVWPERVDDDGLLRWHWDLDPLVGEPRERAAGVVPGPLVERQPRARATDGQFSPGEYIETHLPIRCTTCRLYLPPKWVDVLEMLDRARAVGVSSLNLGRLVYDRTSAR
jgi:hypothetical protein